MERMAWGLVLTLEDIEATLVSAYVRPLAAQGVLHLGDRDCG